MELKFNFFSDMPYTFGQSCRSLVKHQPKNRLICENCHRSFGQRKALTYHQRWECGRMHRCDICLKEFRIILSLKRHMKDIHNRLAYGPSAISKMFL